MICPWCESDESSLLDAFDTDCYDPQVYLCGNCHQDFTKCDEKPTNDKYYGYSDDPPNEYSGGYWDD